MDAAWERVKATGVTWRQYSHWAARGYLRTEQPSGPGSGNVRTITGDEIRALEIMLPLVKAGVAPKMASEYARRLLATGEVILGNTPRRRIYLSLGEPDSI